MAKITFGPVVAEARNKQGGIVYSRGRAGPYTRLKVSGVNPRTARQTAVRTRLVAAASTWRDTLTDTERAGWGALAATITLTDKLRNSYQPTGQQLYCAAFANHQLIGGPPPSQPNPPFTPAQFASTPVPALSLATTFTITWTMAPPPGSWVAIYASPPYPPSRSYLWRHLRFLTVVDGATNTSGDFLADYTALWSLPVLGQRIGFRLQPFDNINALPGRDARLSAQVTA